MTALRGRSVERDALARLVEGVRAGQSAALVVRGEAGVGKTALLDDALGEVANVTTARATGIESEMELAFSALHQLCAPMLDRIDRLPGPQAEALATVFGLQAGTPPDQFLVGLAMLTLLSDVAADRPLVCVVDDAQWLDQASARALSFVARRLARESILLVLAARDPRPAAFDGLPELPIDGLGRIDAGELLQSVVSWPISPPVRDQILAETRGNPLALLELPRGLSPAQLAGFATSNTQQLAGRIEQSYLRRVADLPEATRRLLIVAAADPVGDPALVWNAAALLEVPTSAGSPAVDADLIEFGLRVHFTHPLVRSAVYHGASASERHRVHAALAQVTDAELDPDRRAWHLALASPGPDGVVAAELERCAARAEVRGGVAAAAAFLERSVELSVDPDVRARRALTAAQTKLNAGDPEAALALVRVAQAGPLDALGTAQALVISSRVAAQQRRGNDSAAMLLEAAQQLERLDLSLARATYLDAFWAALFAGRLSGGVGLREVSVAALAAPMPTEPAGSDLLLDGFATLIVDESTAAVRAIQHAVRAFVDVEISAEDELRWLFQAGMAALSVWDDEAYDRLTRRHVELGRSAGALMLHPISCSSRIHSLLQAGELDAASLLLEEIRTVSEVVGTPFPVYPRVSLYSWLGRADLLGPLIEPTLRDLRARGEGQGISVVQSAVARLCNGLGEYDRAFVAARDTQDLDAESMMVANQVLPELIEAAVRTGRIDDARDGVDRLAEFTQACGTEWALGIEARSRALVTEGEGAEACYREAIELLDRPRVRVHQARARLLFGEWLRRQKRRVDARAQLLAAFDMFSSMGAEAFAERARHELAATGEAVRRRPVDTPDQLTPQEAQIARLARNGLTNPEIGTQLFISSRTVEYHLRKVFAKLGITSRRQLGTTLTDAET